MTWGLILLSIWNFSKLGGQLTQSRSSGSLHSNRFAHQYHWQKMVKIVHAILFRILRLKSAHFRYRSMLSLVIPFTIGWALTIWAKNFAMLIVSRVFIGVAGGAFCVAAPMYIGEIAQKEIRGTLGSYFQLMLTIGILFVYAVGAGVSVLWLSVICGIIPLIFGVVFFLMPGKLLTFNNIVIDIS